MSYRKITISGKTYEYVIGKVFIKIKDFGLFKVSEVGNKFAKSNNEYQCTPATIASIIKKEKLPRIFHCKEHNVFTMELRVNPFLNDIHNNKSSMINCQECYDNIAADM